MRRWYVSFAVDVPGPEQLPPPAGSRGWTWGSRTSRSPATASGSPTPGTWNAGRGTWPGTSGGWPAARRRSANRAKAKAKVARAHRKVRAARTDFLHKASTSLVRDYDVIVLEDLAVKNMVRNRKLAKAISDCGWGTFRAMTAYKAARYGRRVITVDRWYPSSKTARRAGISSPT